MIQACVVDTDVVSYLFRNSPTARLYREHLVGKLLVISFMTLAEIRFGMLQGRWGARRIARMEAYLKRFVLYTCDDDLCDTWAQVVYSERAKGRIISAQDAWIAATAIQNGVPLVTHNRKHFDGVDNLAVISEAGV
jgi:predicted nucleic acid-binding protein